MACFSSCHGLEECTPSLWTVVKRDSMLLLQIDGGVRTVDRIAGWMGAGAKIR